MTPHAFIATSDLDALPCNDAPAPAPAPCARAAEPIDLPRHSDADAFPPPVAEDADDELLLERLAQGNALVFARLYSRHDAAVYRVVCRTLGRTHAHRAADVFRQLWLQLATTRRPAWARGVSCRAGLLAAAVHAGAREKARGCTGGVAAPSAEPDNAALDGPATVPAELELGLPPGASTGDDPGYWQGAGLRLLRSLDSLTHPQRALVVLHHGEGVPLAELAAALGIESGAARLGLLEAQFKLEQDMGAYLWTELPVAAERLRPLDDGVALDERLHSAFAHAADHEAPPDTALSTGILFEARRIIAARGGDDAEADDRGPDRRGGPGLRKKELREGLPRAVRSAAVVLAAAVPLGAAALWWAPGARHGAPSQAVTAAPHAGHEHVRQQTAEAANSARAPVHASPLHAAPPLQQRTATPAPAEQAAAQASAARTASPDRPLQAAPTTVAPAPPVAASAAAARRDARAAAQRAREGGSADPVSRLDAALAAQAQGAPSWHEAKAIYRHGVEQRRWWARVGDATQGQWRPAAAGSDVLDTQPWLAMRVGGQPMAELWLAGDTLWLRDGSGTWQVRTSAAQRNLWESMVAQW